MIADSDRRMKEVFHRGRLILRFDVASRLQMSATSLNFDDEAPFLHNYVAGCLHMIHLLPRKGIAQWSVSAVQS